VPAETQKIAIRLDADARLVAAAGGIARYFADAAGLAGEAVSALQTATITLCNQQIEKLQKSNGGIEVAVTRSPDRIEVSVSTPATSGAAPQEEQPKTIAGVDQVERDLRDDKEVTRLTKYVNAAASSQ
jgi:hypothetical protein